MSAVELFLFTLTNLSIDNNNYTKYEVPYVSHDDYSEYKEQKQMSITNDYISVIKNKEENNFDIQVKENIQNDELKNDELEMSEELTENLNEVLEIKDIDINKEEAISDDYKEEDIFIEERVEDTKYYDVSGKEIIGDVKVIDVSYHQGKIDWEKFKNESNCYGVILRIGYYNYLDSSFEYNLSELKRLNIPYGIYLFSYAKDKSEALLESDFVYKKIIEYEVEPILGIYYDIESWKTNTKDSDNITSSMYKNIITTFIDNLNMKLDNKYKVKLYCNRWYATTKLKGLEELIDWVAEYNKTCKYKGKYSLWQYTSKGSVPGINGNVDISYLIK